MTKISIVPFVKRAKNIPKLGKKKPLWFETVTRNYLPFESCVRKEELSIGKPQKIVYPEDEIRINFHSKFPIEAHRRMLFKKSIDELPEDSIEHAIKHQLQLMKEYGVDEMQAQKTAIHFFQTNRKRLEIEARVARQQMEQQIPSDKYYGPLRRILLEEKHIMELSSQTKE